MHRPTFLSIALALTLSALACAKGAMRPSAPDQELHYPAWMAALGDHQLLVVNLDQDLAFDSGALVALDASAPDPTPGANNARPVLNGVAVPNMAGQLLVVDATTAGTCAGNLDKSFAVPFALVAGRFDSNLYAVSLAEGAAAPVGTRTAIDLHPFTASEPFGIGFSCSPDGTPRAWVGYLAGQNNDGYLTRVDLSMAPGAAGSLVEVNVGRGAPRSFAYDAGHDRLYFTGREVDQAAPVRWIQVGSGCANADSNNGIQDERAGGCHVDAGFDLSLQFRGAEPNEIALSSASFDCTTPGFTGQACRRAYLSVRMYDADLAAFLGGRPTNDVGGKLMVLELPEGGLGRPEPQVVGDLDIGMEAGGLHVIARPGQRDLVAVTAIDDSLLWIYDDQIGAAVKVFGRNTSGVPVLGHQLTAIAGQPMAGAERLFVTSYRDDWVSAVDVPLDDPASAEQVMIFPDPTQPTLAAPWRLGVTP